MNKKDIEKYSEVKKNIYTTSEVIKDSFQMLLNDLNKDDYVIVENKRHKKTLVVQEIKTFIENKDKHTEKEIISDYTKANILTRTLIKENIYFLMRFESNNITFPKIESIINKDGLTKKGFDIKVTEQLIEAWQKIIYDRRPFDFNYFLDLQAIIARGQALEWGTLRKKQIYISGTNYEPPIPKKDFYIKLFNDFKKSKDKIKYAAFLLAKLIKSQAFYDGNKRTAFLSVAKLLMENSLGTISLNENHFNDFNILLNNYYNDDNDMDQLIDFIQDKMIREL